jgi:hypothetical protein
MGDPFREDPASSFSPPSDSPQVGPPDNAAKRPHLEATVRALSAVSAAGALLGVVVGGVGGRLAMALLAAQNPEDAGRLTDDGFTIGQFTVGGTIQLIVAGLQLGLLAAVIYLALRGLALGPRWLRVAELTAGGTAVVSAILIDPDPRGVDFTILDPDWLPVVLFLAIPALFLVLLCLLAEHWLGSDSWFATAPVRMVGAMLLVWIFSGPLIVLGAVALGVGVAWRHVTTADTERRPSSPQVWAMWALRALFGILGTWAFVTVVDNIAAVT